MTKSETVSLALAIGVLLVAILLSVWTWLERGDRRAAVTDQDRRYFARREIRRWVVSGTMFLLALGIYAGSRMPPRVGGGPNLLFLQTWLWVILLVFILIVLAGMDWVATRVYSIRQRKAMLREGIDILRDELRVRTALRQNGDAEDEMDGSGKT